MQTYIAKKLGATLDGDMRWTSPENEDAQAWANKFTIELAIHEQNIWSETIRKNKSLEEWLDEFQRSMEAEKVYDGITGIVEILAG
jgi:hypothetical protein